MRLGGVSGVFAGLRRVARRCVRVMSGLLVIARFMLLGSLGMVARRMGMMVSGLLVMICSSP